MQIINKIQIDLLSRGIVSKIDAVQNDANSRGVEISLIASGTPWKIPAGVTAAVAFRKPDGTNGLYDKLPDGTAAITLSDSTVTAIFAPEMLTVTGLVRVSVIFNDANLNQLATFPFDVVVEENPAAGAVVSNNYYNYQTLGDINKALETINATLPHAVLFTEQELSEGQQARGRQNIGAAADREVVKTVNGHAPDKDGAVKTIDDTKAGSDAWSSKNIVDRLCPAFTESGAVVSCEPVEGYPLGVVSQIEPVQAGEGDPYPPGGGKNLFDDVAWFKSHGFTPQADGSWLGTEVNEICFTNTAKKAGSMYLTSCAKVDADSNTPMYFYVYYTDGTEKACLALNNNITTFTTLTAQTDPAKTVDYIKWTYGSGGTYYVKDVQISFVDSAYEPYSNIRPIAGWTGAKLHRGGKNLFYSNRTQANTTCGITCVCTKGSSAIVLDGTATEESSIRFVQNLLLKAGTYTVSVFGTNNIDSAHDRIYLRYTNEDGTVGHVNHIMAGKPKTFTFNADTVIHCDIVYAAGSAYNNKEIFVQIEKGSAATQYEPYRGEEFTLDFGQTVYGGSLDWASGVLTVDKALLTLTGTEAWSNSDINMNVRVRIAVADIKCTLTNSSIIHAICSHYQPVSANDTYDGRVGFSGHDSTRVMYFNDGERTADVETWKAFLAEQYAAGTPVQVCYPMVNPVTVQLTPQEVLALSGTNTLYSDTGDTVVMGRADPGAIIEAQQATISSVLERIAALETAVISNT